MWKSILVLIFAFVVWDVQAEIKEIYLPTLDCQEHTFQDVSINYDTEKTDKSEVTISLVCEKLRSKLAKQSVVSDLSRFVIDKLAPEQMEGQGARANDFFKLILFKPSVIGKDKFDFTEQELPEIIERLRSPKYLRLRTFAPSKDYKHVLAYHISGAAFLNKLKLKRTDCSMINTLVHEYMHHVGYSHGDNDSTGKENSVPYFFGNRAEELCKAGVI